MSHINDLINVLRGLRLVVEAGVKTQQEVASLVWNNSSVRPLLASCPTNLVTINPNPASAKELVDRALVVAHGFRQFVNMHVPNSEARPKMDQQMKDDIDELNREFNRTFDTLKKVQITDEPPLVAPPTMYPSPAVFTPIVQVVEPLEDLQIQVRAAKLQKVENILEAISSPGPVEEKPSGSAKVVPPVKLASHAELEDAAGSSGRKPMAKKKIRVAVSIKL